MKKEESNDKFLIVIALILGIVLIIVAVDIFQKVSKEKPTQQTETKTLTEYYYCYKEKNELITCGNYLCKYTSYYKFKIDEKDSVKSLDGSFKSEYKLNKENFNDVNPQDFIDKSIEYKVDAKNYTYITSQNMALKPSQDIELNIQNELEYLKELGFNECETRYE